MFDVTSNIYKKTCNCKNSWSRKRQKHFDPDAVICVSASSVLPMYGLSEDKVFFIYQFPAKSWFLIEESPISRYIEIYEDDTSRGARMKESFS